MTFVQSGVAFLLLGSVLGRQDAEDGDPMERMMEALHKTAQRFEREVSSQYALQKRVTAASGDGAPSYNYWSVVNLDAAGVDSTVYYADARGNLATASVGSILGADMPMRGAVILGQHENEAASSTEWTSTALAGTAFVHTPPDIDVSRGNPQTFTVHALERADVTLNTQDACAGNLGLQSLQAGEQKKFKVQCLDKEVRFSSTGRILVKVAQREGNAVDVMPIPPAAFAIYGTCSKRCCWNLLSEGTSASVAEKCTDGSTRNFEVNGHYLQTQTDSSEDHYLGKSCVWTATDSTTGEPVMLAGSSHADGDGADATSLLPRSLFQKITPVPPLEYLKIVSDQRAHCTFRKNSGSEQQFNLEPDTMDADVYHWRLTEQEGGILECDEAVMALGDKEMREVQLIVAQPLIYTFE